MIFWRNRRARLHDLVAFNERQARMLQDSIFGGFHDPLSNVGTIKSKTTVGLQPNRFKSKGSSFASTLAIVPDSQVKRSIPEKSLKGNISSSSYDTYCLFWTSKHP